MVTYVVIKIFVKFELVWSYNDDLRFLKVKSVLTILTNSEYVRPL